MALSPFTRAAAVRGGLVALAAGAAGFAVARAGGWGTGEAGTIAANAYGTTPAGGRRLAALDDIPSGGGVILADEGVVLVRGEDDDVHAFSATCTHQGCPVAEVTDGRIICPCHNSVFDAETGEPIEGPAPSPLESIDVVVEGGDVLTG